MPDPTELIDAARAIEEAKAPLPETESETKKDAQVPEEEISTIEETPTETPVETEEKEPVATSEEPKEESKKEENKIPQSRLDKEVAKRKEAEEKIKEFEVRMAQIERMQAQVPEKKEVDTPDPERPLKRFNTDDLLAHKSSNPDSSYEVDRELMKRTEESIDNKLKAQQTQQQLQQQQLQQIYARYPDLKDQNSALFQKTKEVFHSNPAYAQAGIPGQQAAADAAMAMLLEQQVQELKSQLNTTDKTKRKANLEKEKLKKVQSLDAGGRVSAPANTDAEFEALEETAMMQGPGSPEFIKYMKLVEKRKHK